MVKERCFVVSFLDSLTVEDNRLNAIVVATYFIDKGIFDCKPIGVSKVQSLVFLAQGWCLGFSGTPLIKESILSSSYNPVIPDLYKKISHWRESYITVTPQDNVLALYKSKFSSSECELSDVERLLKDKIELLDSVWNCYGKKSPSNLALLTHPSDAPWSKAERVLFGEEILNEEIYLYYKNIIDNHKSKGRVSV